MEMCRFKFCLGIDSHGVFLRWYEGENRWETYAVRLTELMIESYVGRVLTEHERFI